MTEIDFFQATDTGPVRNGNEDSIGAWPHEDGLAFAVADGLGGHAAGEVASALALEVLGRELDRAPGSWDVGKRLRRSVQEANLAIHGKAIAIPELSGMATTVTASVVCGDNLVAAHVGDCRLYLVRGDEVIQLTKDHTWVAEQVQYGLMSAQAARSHPNRSRLTRCLGMQLIVGIDVLVIPVQAGDVLVQMSDGVHAVLEDATIASVAKTSKPEDACRMLIARAIEAGSEDNLSAQVAVVAACTPSSTPRRRWWHFGR
ncbi:MAG TPA: protein phosphatase 2C domain-containing protein [Candidatus Binatia bacterium]|jgi:protein phosphatase